MPWLFIRAQHMLDRERAGTETRTSPQPGLGTGSVIEVGTLKTEFYDRRRWATWQDAIRATGRWIEEFYNRARLHSALGYTTPVEHEQFLTMKKPQRAQAA